MLRPVYVCGAPSLFLVRRVLKFPDLNLLLVGQAVQAVAPGLIGIPRDSSPPCIHSLPGVPHKWFISIPQDSSSLISWGLLSCLWILQLTLMLTIYMIPENSGLALSLHAWESYFLYLKKWLLSCYLLYIHWVPVLLPVYRYIEFLSCFLPIHISSSCPASSL